MASPKPKRISKGEFVNRFTEIVSGHFSTLPTAEQEKRLRRAEDRMGLAEQLRSQIAAYAEQRISQAEFEDWFGEASENAHLWANSTLEDFVFSVEAVFSERDFARLSKRDMRTRLQEVARRFATPHGKTGLV